MDALPCRDDLCTAPVYALGRCRPHYRRFKYQQGKLQPGRECSVPACGRRHAARGLCAGHLYRLQTRGDVQADTPLAARRAWGEPWVGGGGYLYTRAHGHPIAGLRGQVLVHRLVLWDKLGGHDAPCAYCGRPLLWLPAGGWNDPAQLHADHVNAVKLDNRPANLVPSCNPCNASRGRQQRWGPE